MLKLFKAKVKRFGSMHSQHGRTLTEEESQKTTLGKLTKRIPRAISTEISRIIFDGVLDRTARRNIGDIYGSIL